MNVELALEVKRHILEHPETADMSRWQCGTTACIAGWTVLLGYALPGESLDDACDRHYNETARIGGYAEIACRLLDIPDDESDFLFYSADWDEDLANLYDSAPTPEIPHPKAAAMALRINRLIAKHAN